MTTEVIERSLNLVLLTFSIVLLLILLLVMDFKIGERVYQKNPPNININQISAKYDLFTDGNTLFTSFFQDLRNAKKSINVMFYIVRNDELSREMYQILKEKAREGVSVRFLVDRIGSLKLSREIIQDLKTSGVHFAYSNQPTFPLFFYKLNRRNHRKISIIDDEIGYIGGFNIGKEYIGADPKLGAWRDYHLKVTGNIVEALQFVFKYDWSCALAKKRLPVPKYNFELERSIKSLMNIFVTESGQLEERMVQWIDKAKSEILIGTPYFIPTNRVMKALVAALDRGVEVSLLVPEKADHLFVKSGALPFYKQFLQSGGKGYLYTNGFYHAKVMIIDETFCDIGTANFDQRSMILNKEINAVIDSNTGFIKDIRTAYFRDVESSKSLTENWIKQQPISTKLSAVIARCIRPLL
ncbi:cardiolipin synthase [Aquibacillus kalidii]|uniref:cardiolipin synthase n=1 Tax=Aquibacillus kalidii TaxID=2762597 RepID=UPI001C99C112|nr:cardiolipin synthase [Aquibacillus kalidii]